MTKDDEITPPCCGEVITNTANGKEFYVCKSCKEEVTWPSLEDCDVEKDDVQPGDLTQLLDTWDKRMRVLQKQTQIGKRLIYVTTPGPIKLPPYVPPAPDPDVIVAVPAPQVFKWPTVKSHVTPAQEQAFITATEDALEEMKQSILRQLAHE